MFRKPPGFARENRGLSAASLEQIGAMMARQIQGDGHVQATHVGDKVMLGFNPRMKICEADIARPLPRDSIGIYIGVTGHAYFHTWPHGDPNFVVRPGFPTDVEYTTSQMFAYDYAYYLWMKEAKTPELVSRMTFAKLWHGAYEYTDGDVPIGGGLREAHVDGAGVHTIYPEGALPVDFAVPQQHITAPYSEERLLAEWNAILAEMTIEQELATPLVTENIGAVIFGFDFNNGADAPLDLQIQTFLIPWLQSRGVEVLMVPIEGGYATVPSHGWPYSGPQDSPWLWQMAYVIELFSAAGRLGSLVTGESGRLPTIAFATRSGFVDGARIRTEGAPTT